MNDDINDILGAEDQPRAADDTPGTKNRARAHRRVARKRIQRQRRRYWGQDLDRVQRGKVVDTPKPHTCPCCGNPRKYDGERTMGERRAVQRERIIESSYDPDA
jgi:hypothetical protein